MDMDKNLQEKCFDFSVRVVKMTQWLQNDKREYVLSKQLIRSGTAIGALMNEAVFAQSKADFISKASIALKEANETRYWINLLKATDYIDTQSHKSISDDITEIIAILVTSVKTAKRNEK